MKKRFLAVFLALALCVGLVPAPAFAAESDFVIKNGELTVYNGPGGDVVIPNGVTSVGGVFYYCSSLTSVTIPSSMTSIGTSAFRGCSNLTSVTIPSSVTSIGYAAFDNCWSLTSVSIPSSVTDIGDYAFSNCSSLTSVSIPSSVTSIGGGAFYYCDSLTSVSIPNSVTSIGYSAFGHCPSLTSVTIPDSVTSIGRDVFRDCWSLTAIQVDANNQSYCSVDGALFTKDMKTMVTCPGGKQGAYSIPNGVTEIGELAFNNCTGLTSVTIPASVKVIGSGAFDEYEYYIDGIETFPSETLKDIYYGGTKEQWDAISINDENLTLKTATIHYNSVIAKFPDMKPNGFYVDAVEWAVANNITTGKTATTFAPNENCTHGQILTFLWRAAGEPESSAQPPIALKGDEFYYKAVKWAAEKGMIGADFNPSAPCTRADAVSYIWQAFGKTTASYDGRFTDVPRNSPYATAAAWAAEKGITTGTTATTFNPSGICNRGQIVTFLYRAYK